MLEPNPRKCGCPDAFAMGILKHLPGNYSLEACMRCGEIVFALAIVTEPHPSDVHCLGYQILDLPEDVKAWVDGCPRYCDADKGCVYLAPYIRFQTAEEIAAAVAKAAIDQAGMTLRDILLGLGMPANHPPSSMPEVLSGLSAEWHGLLLTDSTPIDHLLEAATRFNGPRRMANEVLARRSDLLPLAVTLLSDLSETRRKGGRYLIHQFKLVDPAILPPLRGRLAQLDDNMSGELQEIYFFLREVPMRVAASMLPDLESAAARINGRDYYAHKDLVEICQNFSDYYAKVATYADRIEAVSKSAPPGFQNWLQIGFLPILRHAVAERGTIPDLSGIGVVVQRELEGVAGSEALVELMCEFAKTLATAPAVPKLIWPPRAKLQTADALIVPVEKETKEARVPVVQPPTPVALTAREVAQNYYRQGNHAAWTHSNPRRKESFDTALAERTLTSATSLIALWDDEALAVSGAAVFRTHIEADRGQWVVVTVLRDDSGVWRVDSNFSIDTTARWFLSLHRDPPYTREGNARGRAMLFWKAVQQHDDAVARELTIDRQVPPRLGCRQINEFFWYLDHTQDGDTATVRVLMNLESEHRLWNTVMKLLPDGKWYVAATE